VTLVDQGREAARNPPAAAPFLQNEARSSHWKARRSLRHAGDMLAELGTNAPPARKGPCSGDESGRPSARNSSACPRCPGTRGASIDRSAFRGSNADRKRTGAFGKTEENRSVAGWKCSSGRQVPGRQG